MFERAIISAVLALVLAPVTILAQDWRDVNSFRQRGDETRMDVEVRYGAGRLVIEPGQAGELYRVGIRYDSDLFDPLTEYRAGRLKVGLEGTGRSLRLRNQEAGAMTLTLSPDVPLDLGLAFGAVEADLRLGGLRVSRLKIETGASDSRMGFDGPNPIACERLELSMGAAAFRAEGLANANCARLKVEGGVGDITLDFSGQWRRDMTADVSMALGALTLVVPDDVGVVVRRSTFLTSFNGRGFSKRGRNHYSENWDRAGRKLTVEVQGAFGSINVRWAAAAGVPPAS